MEMNDMEDLMGYLKDELPLMDPERLQVRPAASWHSPSFTPALEWYCWSTRRP